MTAGVGRNTPAPQFVELSPVRPPAEAASWRVVIQQADGLQVQLDFRTVDASSVEAARHLVQALVLERDGVR